MQPASELAPAHHGRSFSDAAVVGVAIAAVCGSFAAVGLPAPVVVAAAASALVVPLVRRPLVRRPLVVAAAAFVLCSFLADRSLDGLAVPDDTSVSGRAVLVTDPERFGPTVRVDVRLDGHRYEVWLRGGQAGLVDEQSAGDSVEVSGRIRPPGPDDESWFRPRHVVGRLDLDAVTAPQSAGPPWSWANAVRSVLRDGLDVLDEDERVLALGFLVGDDRGLDPVVADDFRAAGLTHLSAVSGQNVAFVLVLVQPMLRLFGRRGRLMGVVAVLGLFGFVTRWEPSVMRATAMVGVALAGAFGGRQASGVRYLALAVTGLMVIDPLLVWSIGFRLSVAASLGILTLAPTLARCLRGPRLLREALAVTVAAQLAVAPLLLTTFGPVPVASVPANVLAGPAAGLAMMWGLPAGLVAGLLGGAAATVLHVPTGLSVSWVAGVARWSASLPLPTLGAAGVVAVATMIGAVVVRRRGPRSALCVVVAAGAVLGVVVGHGPSDGHRSGTGIDVWRRGGVVVALDRPSVASALGELRSAGVDRIDLLVVRSPSRQASEVAAAVAVRHAVGERIDASSATGAATMAVGELSVTVDVEATGRLTVTVDEAP